MSKKINEENLITVSKNIKRVPMTPKKLWQIGLTKGKLLEIMKDLPDETPIITAGFDHTYDHIGVRLSTALFDNKSDTINEDFGEDLTPEEKYGVRKQVLIVL